MFWTNAKLGIVNLAHATQIYPWEPKPGVFEVRAAFPGGDTLTISEHGLREEAVERVLVLLRRLGGEPTYFPESTAAPSFVREDRNGKLHFDDAADKEWTEATIKARAEWEQLKANAAYRAGVGAM